MIQRPHRQLLQADDVGAIGGDEVDHLAQEGAAPWRERLAVEQIPRAHEHCHVRSV
jgi:hypothetical protein